MFYFKKVNISNSYFIHLKILLFDHLWGNDILNVDLHDRNVLHNIDPTFSSKLN